MKALRWKGPVFRIAAINGEGCRALTFAIQEWLDEHPSADVPPRWAKARRARRSSSSRAGGAEARADGTRRAMTSVVEAARRLVVKVGSSLVTNEGAGLDHAAVARWARQIAALRARGREVVLVSSRRDRRRHAAPRLERRARTRSTSCRPPRPSARWASCRRTSRAFASTACTPRRCCSRTRTSPTAAATSTRARRCARCCALGVIPIINENDTVATDEIRFGDNDTLGALVTNLIEADVLVMLTDQRGPLHRRSAQAIPTRDARARGARRRSGARSDGGRRGQRDRPRRHADQGAGGQARGALAARTRSSPRAARPTCCCGSPRGEAIGTAARRRARRRSPRASNGSPITCSSPGASRSTRARCAR